MRLLLDTHIALWALADDQRLHADARALIADRSHTIYVSVASLWKIAIKYTLGRSGLPFNAAAATDFFAQAGYVMLPVKPEHTDAVETLPSLHHDPFDRMLVAQALTEPMRLITHDTTVAKYSTAIMHV